MPAKKKTVVTVEADSPSQNEIGHVITSSLKIHGNSIVSSVFENSEDLELSRAQVEKIQVLVKACTSKSVDATLNQLLKLY